MCSVCFETIIPFIGIEFFFSIIATSIFFFSCCVCTQVFHVSKLTRRLTLFHFQHCLSVDGFERVAVKYLNMIARVTCTYLPCLLLTQCELLTSLLRL